MLPVFTFFMLAAFSCIFQFLSPTLYGIDGYYHIKVASLIRTQGLHFDFPWAQFSTFVNSFGDKDLVLHLLSLPFTGVADIVTAGKLAVIFINIIFIAAFIFVLKKYLSNSTASLFVLIPFLSTFFFVNFLLLRPATLVTVINILGVYFLIKKQWVKTAFLSFLYPLTHISFPLMIIFAFVCESVRYFNQKEFFFRNIAAVIAGVSLGCVLHPHFPNNLLVFYLNAILVPVHLLGNSFIDFGSSLLAPTTKYVLFANFIPILMLAFLIWDRFTSQIKLSLSTLVFLAITCLYIFLSFISGRFWYQIQIFIVIFAASYLRDSLSSGRKIDFRKLSSKIAVIFCLIIVIIYSLWSLENTFSEIQRWTNHNTHYELTAKWMNDNIPNDEIIYHTYWKDAAYFFCLNPENNYIVILDPIFMFYRSPDDYLKYRRLKNGLDSTPHKTIKNMGIRFGYTMKNSKLYLQIRENPNFTIIYEDSYGIVFKITS